MTDVHVHQIPDASVRMQCLRVVGTYLPLSIVQDSSVYHKHDLLIAITCRE